MCSPMTAVRVIPAAAPSAASGRTRPICDIRGANLDAGKRSSHRDSIATRDDQLECGIRSVEG